MLQACCKPVVGLFEASSFSLLPVPMPSTGAVPPASGIASPQSRVLRIKTAEGRLRLQGLNEFQAGVRRPRRPALACSPLILFDQTATLLHADLRAHGVLRCVQHVVEQPATRTRSRTRPGRAVPAATEPPPNAAPPFRSDLKETSHAAQRSAQPRRANGARLSRRRSSALGWADFMGRPSHRLKPKSAAGQFRRSDMFIVPVSPMIRSSSVGAAWPSPDRTMPPRWGLRRFCLGAGTINMPTELAA